MPGPVRPARPALCSAAALLYIHSALCSIGQTAIYPTRLPLESILVGPRPRGAEIHRRGVTCPFAQLLSFMMMVVDD